MLHERRDLFFQELVLLQCWIQLEELTSNSNLRLDEDIQGELGVLLKNEAVTTCGKATGIAKTRPSVNAHKATVRIPTRRNSWPALEVSRLPKPLTTETIK